MKNLETIQTFIKKLNLQDIIIATEQNNNLLLTIDNIVVHECVFIGEISECTYDGAVSFLKGMKTFENMITDTDNLMDEFQLALKRYKETFESTEQDLADELFVSIPTINRWLKGENLPHVIIANGLTSYLNGKVKEANNGNN